MKYAILKIPFATKKYIWSNEKSGLKIRGNAFYVFDLENNVYIDEYIELKEANYRLTDKSMLKTNYYKNKTFKNFRDNFLDRYYTINPISIESTIYKELNNFQIVEINNQFKSMKITIRSMFACLSGSNPSGAETFHKSTPILCIEPDDNLFKCNFANVLKNYESKEKNKIQIQELKNKYKEFKEYNLNSFIKHNLIKDFENTFIFYNQDKFWDIKIEKKDDTKDQLKKYRDSKENQELFIYSYINKKLDGNIGDKKFKQKLRSFYTSNIEKCLRMKKIEYSFVSEKFIGEIENAHIISFSELTSSNNIKNIMKAIDPYNCLRIYPNEHRSFDKGNIKFDKQGNIVSAATNKILKTNYLDMSKLHINTKKYFLEYLRKK
ncbi:MAG: hypothetical protein HDR43_01995 [Mycoplasma sp.]|nr:hypothetical protein [Mycoplasma sp.]